MEHGRFRMEIKRGQIVLVGFDPVIGSEQGKTRPALIIQNNIGNKYSATTIVAPITSKVFSREYPTCVELYTKYSPLKKNSTILLNQIRTIDTSRIIKRYGVLDESIMKKVDDAIKISLGIN